MSTNIKIEKICEWCGNKFTAQTTVARFCSKRCAVHSYKERMRQKKIALSNQETQAQSSKGNKWKDKEFLTPTQVAEILGIGRMTIYRYIRDGKIKVKRFDRKTLIAKSDLMAMFDYFPPREAASVTTEKKGQDNHRVLYTR